MAQRLRVTAPLKDAAYAFEFPTWNICITHKVITVISVGSVKGTLEAAEDMPASV